MQAGKDAFDKLFKAKKMETGHVATTRPEEESGPDARASVELDFDSLAGRGDFEIQA